MVGGLRSSFFDGIGPILGVGGLEGYITVSGGVDREEGPLGN